MGGKPPFAQARRRVARILLGPRFAQAVTDAVPLADRIPIIGHRSIAITGDCESSVDFEYRPSLEPRFQRAVRDAPKRPPVVRLSEAAVTQANSNVCAAQRTMRCKLGAKLNTIDCYVPK